MSEKEYSVSETVRLVGVESHVLRYWEEELHIEIRRTSQGHRIYSQKNVDTFCRVKELKDKGLQLKAIRVLLDGTERAENQEFVEELREIEQGDREHGEDQYEIVSVEEKPDNLKQFEAILKHILEEVVAEQNEKLERALIETLREELEGLYLQYDQLSAKEAAATGAGKGRRNKIWELLKQYLGKEKRL